LPQLRIGFSHALQSAYGPNPKQRSHYNSPPRSQAETQRGSDEHRTQHQFAIPAKQLVGPVDGGVYDDAARLCGGFGHR
jgi:hypothetical protein